MPKIFISPSILSADVDKLNEDVATLIPNADTLHVDIMDGKFVSNTTFSIEQIKAITHDIPFDVHLMVENPQDYFIPEYAKLEQTQTIIFHVESVDDPRSCIKLIKGFGKRVGITLKPNTPLNAIHPFLDSVEQVLIMTVEPGKGGQSFLPDMLEKVKAIRKEFPNLDINVDGGINDTTITDAADAGANIFVSGSFIFGKVNRRDTIESLRQKAETCHGRESLH